MEVWNSGYLPYGLPQPKCFSVPVIYEASEFRSNISVNQLNKGIFFKPQQGTRKKLLFRPNGLQEHRYQCF